MKEVHSTHKDMWSGKLGKIRRPPHRIKLIAGATLVHSQPYTARPKIREHEFAEVRRMLDAGVIEPARTEWASLVVFVPKPDGSRRFCVDYRRLNALTVKDTYRLPRIDQVLDSLSNSQFFTTLDCNSGYWQLPVAPEDQDKTMFTCHTGTYEITRMPFGPCNALGMLHKIVDILLSGFKSQSC